jgi:acyl-CoA thioester hydrolase
VESGPESFEMRHQVDPSEIDQLGHVSNIVYLRWVQDVSIAHWEAAASAEDQAKFFWVVVRHEIDYLRPVLPDDEVVLRTWVGAAVKRRFDRHTEIVRARDDRVCARARTVWCPMDMKTGRPTHVSDEIRKHFSEPSP